MSLFELVTSGDVNEYAITSQNKNPLTYSQLKFQIKKIGYQLAGLGLSAKDRVAIVLPNGPEMAVSFLSISCFMSAAPLNPNYTENEFEFYLNDLKPKLIITIKDFNSNLLTVAKKLKINLIEIKVLKDSPSGIFDLCNLEKDILLPEENNEALVLHTSGTTSRPKVVPLSQKNIIRSAENISLSLNLTNKDHCLNIMPLFHIHGLIAVVVSSLSQGASICCSNGFNAVNFLELANKEKITWYSGVPTMHQAILFRAIKNKLKAKNLNLRFIRSSSASLPPNVFNDLNKTFDCPVVEAYGMTEAAHQMTSNPIQNNKQKAGFVGIVTNPKVKIKDNNGNNLKLGEEGEICIKGENVTKGYENNDKANQESFYGEWFRTGDQGYFDSDGYLKITGRLKEIINRGGEKISPIEIDNILMEHNEIMQVVTFSIPDKLLGEDIAVAIVKKEGSKLTESEIKSYAKEKLAKFKIPKKVLFLNEIPKGTTGKLQRIGLAQKLNLIKNNK